MGSPKGKQDEVRKRLLKYGIKGEQLTVREFVKSRERRKELFCEVDMVIMPSKEEGFGLVALEALSAGLPILVGSNSGFARAMKNIPFGKYSTVANSEDPARWAEAIEDVRDRHGVVLVESEKLKEHYSKKYCWKKQCEELIARLWKIVYGKVWLLFLLKFLIIVKELAPSLCPRQKRDIDSLLNSYISHSSESEFHPMLYEWLSNIIVKNFS